MTATGDYEPLHEQDVDADPVRQFAAWYEQAEAAGLAMPEAAALATASAQGAPSVRMVLVKAFAHDGFRFYSNYASRKGEELRANPRAALLFHWQALGRQVRLEGPVRQIGARESERYVRSRPRGSQLSALASPQSQVIDSRAQLERRVAELEQAHAGGELPMPDNWGGFCLQPEMFEFWQQRRDRLHDRLRYRREAGAWLLERLAP
jgi:pyridoxamine 5'-phosphate oxidase